MSKYVFLFILLGLSTSCKSQALLPFSDIFEIEKGKSFFSTYTCDELIEKSEDKDFSLKNLAGIRAMARCKDFKYDLGSLSPFEKRIYANEIENIKPSGEGKTADLSVADLKKAIKNEKDGRTKLGFYKLLRNKIKKTNRKDYIFTTNQMLKWAQSNYKQSKKSPEAAEVLYEAAQIHVRTYWTSDDGKTASKTIDETIKTIDIKRSLAELYFLKGRINEESKNFSQAVVNYDLALADVETYKPKTLTFNVDRVLWLKAWIVYKQKDYLTAEAAFKALIANTEELSEKSRAQFYLGRTLKNLNREVEAKALFENTIQNDFFGYYGLVSYRELGKKFPAIKSLKPNNSLNFDTNLSFLASHERSIFKDLIKFREFNLAERSLIILATTKENDLNLAIYTAKKAHIFMPLFISFSKLSNEEKVDVFLAYPELIFPQPYKDHVEQMAQKTKLPTSLIYSIMKQESAFNEKARSSADAFGLMQVIPSLAKQLSRKFEVPFRSSEDLYNPAINIQIGSYELMEQVRKQNGQLTYVAAAYNAGPGALSSWLKTRKRDDVLEFIEEIPYEETRTYVKLIARNKAFYERISNRDTEQDFPPDFLN